MDSSPPGTPWEFDISSPFADFNVELPAAGGNAILAQGQLPAGSWTITETEKFGWEVEVECTTGDSSLTNEISFGFVPGDDVVCTFYNAFPQ